MKKVFITKNNPVTEIFVILSKKLLLILIPADK